MSDHPSNKITEENLKEVIYWHKPTHDQINWMESIAYSAEKLMEKILGYCPDCADRNEALRCVRNARMWANASIAIDPVHEAEIDHLRGSE